MTTRKLVSRSTPWETAKWLSTVPTIRGRWFREGTWWVSLALPGEPADWIEVEPEEIRASIYEILADQAKVVRGDELEVDFDPRKADVDEVYDALKSCLYDIDELVDMGAAAEAANEA